jgi:SAM-dependent methyltransferase
MAYLLFPGRHVLNTRFQEEYLFSVLNRPIAQLDLWNGNTRPTEPLSEVIFAITSSNQDHSRYNPVPFHVRAVSVDRFGRRLRDALGVSYRIVGIPHYGPTQRFAQHVLKEIEEQTEGALDLTPGNTVVLSSVPTVMAMFEAEGFNLLPAELTNREAPYTWDAELPLDLVKRLAELGPEWVNDDGMRKKLAPSSFSVLMDFDEVPQRIIRLFRDPLLNEQGSLTDTRDYATYARQMDSIIELKYQEIKSGIVPGRIVDEGCSDGGLLAKIAKDFPDSDLIGIDIAAEFIARCHERQRAGEFGGAFVHFHQRNLLDPIFEPGSIDTTICNSTLHELWSYGDQASTLTHYFAEKYRQSRKGGRLVIRDVVGFPEKDETILMWLNDEDGANGNPFEEFASPPVQAKFLAGLSTKARFQRFAKDFLADMRAKGKRGPESELRYEWRTIDGKEYAQLRFGDAVEFLTKKDYADNWASEMNEEFAFWSFDEWKAAISKAGFKVVENPNAPETGSRAYRSEWRVKNHFQDKVAFFRQEGEKLVPVEFPVTNMVLIGEK